MHLYFNRAILRIGNEDIRLTRMQAHIMRAIIIGGDRPSSIMDIAEQIWPVTLGPDEVTKTLHVQICRIRQRMGRWAPWIVTRFQFGYVTKIHATWSE